MSVRGLKSRIFEWLQDVTIAKLLALVFVPIFAFLFIAFMLRNPIVTQIPLGDPVTVEVKRSCETAVGPCTGCLPDSDGNMNCASVITGTCPGTQLRLETQQEMSVTRRRGETRPEMIVLSSEPVGACK